MISFVCGKTRCHGFCVLQLPEITGWEKKAEVGEPWIKSHSPPSKYQGKNKEIMVIPPKMYGMILQSKVFQRSGNLPQTCTGLPIAHIQYVAG